MENKRNDFKTSADGELLFANGDLLIGDCDQQHIIDTCNAFPGWWKEHPTDGVGIAYFQNSAGGSQMLARKIKIELESDGYQVNNPVIQFDAAGKLQIYPNATRI